MVRALIHNFCCALPLRLLAKDAGAPVQRSNSFRSSIWKRLPIPRDLRLSAWLQFITGAQMIILEPE